MNTKIYKHSIITLLVMIATASAAFAQVNRTAQVTAAQAQVNTVIVEAGKNFREGMFALKEGKRSESGEKFDKAVEVFLMSTLNVQADQKLQTCYSNLIETVYRMEFPS